MPIVPLELICHVPGCESGEAPLDIQQLAGGSCTNDVWRVVTRKGEFVLRARHGPINRPGSAAGVELASHRLAAAQRLAPQIAAAALDGGWMVMDFISAPAWSETQLLSNAGIDALGMVLQRVHGLDCGELPRLDVALVAQDYFDAIRQRRSADVRDVAAVLEAIHRDAAKLTGHLQRAVLNHGDLTGSNILGAAPVLVDWEYAQCADPTWDVACLLAYYPKLESQLERLLAACGLNTADDRHCLSLQQRQFARLNCLWQKLQPQN